MIIMGKQLYSTSDCAKAVGVQEYQVAYAHRTNKIAEPEFRVAGKRIYQPHEVKQIQAYFNQRRKKTETTATPHERS